MKNSDKSEIGKIDLPILPKIKAIKFGKRGFIYDEI